MFDTAHVNDLENSFYAHTNRLSENKSHYEQTYNDPQLVKQIMLLNETYTYFNDLLTYHQKMGLTDTLIDKMIIDIDDIIDAYEEYDKLSSSNKLLQEYYKKASAFYDLLIRTQVALGFYKVER